MSLSLYPHVGTLGTAAGRTAILAPVFSGEWSLSPALSLYGGESFLIPDPTDPFGAGESYPASDPTDPFGAGDSFPAPDPTDPFGAGDSGLVA